MKSDNVLVTSIEYDAKFAVLIRALEQCAYRQVDCGKCPLEESCRVLFDTLCDKVTHYRLSDAEYKRFMRHFKSLKKQMSFC